MTVCITGATGYVGRHLQQVLIGRGLDVRSISRSADGYNNTIPVGNVGSRTDWTDALDGCSTVVHLAAQLPSRDATRADYLETNYRGTANLVAQCETTGVRQLIFVSSVAAVAGNAGEGISDQTIPNPTNAYGESKLLAEQAVRSFSGTSVILRPPIVIGPEARGNWAMLVKIARLGIPLPLASATSLRSLISIDNLVDALAMLVERQSSEVDAKTFAIADTDPISVSEIITRLRRSSGQPPRLFSLPKAAIKTGMKLAGRRHFYESLFESLTVDSKRFSDHYGWSPLVTTRETIDRVKSRSQSPQ